ncbi:MAG: putative DNA binding domain-containing protein [Myxococcaceae bacterium]|nr:putative DNA binding domain-containing protein [Myxococcaceae bacterium]MCI0670510.1 putative DNA binding domain-containing protein [Myxococcaceae bacterium]
MRRIREYAQVVLAQLLEGVPAHRMESATLDFKQEGRSRDDFLKDLASDAVCFANANGGALIVGVDDKLGGVEALVGTDLDPDLVRRRIYELTEPPLFVEADIQVVERKQLLLLYVPQGIEVHADKKGRSRRRVGRDCLTMTPGDVMLLREERQGFDWSAQPSGRSYQEASALALQAARQSLATLTDERRKYARLTSDRDLLSALGVVSEQGELLRAGELLFCHTTPAPALQYHYRQTPGGEPRAIERIDSPLVLAFERVLELIGARLNQTPVSLPNGQQIDIADFPRLAVREAIANAITHRDYRLHGPVLVEHSPEVLVVSSPGALVAGVTPENILTHPPKPRNPVLARAVRQLGFAEEAGRGVDRMYREMVRAGRELPRIEAAMDQVQVKLVGGAPRTQIARFVAQLPEHERDDTDTLLVLFRLCRSKTVTATDMAPVLQKSEEETEASLKRLASEGLAIVEPTRLTARRARPAYRLTGEVLKALGAAVDYQRRTVDELDRKIIAHVREYGRVNNRTLQNLFDVGVVRARDILSDMVERQLLVKVSAQQRGPAVEYGPGPRFPGRPTKRAPRETIRSSPKSKRQNASEERTLQLDFGAGSERRPRRKK